VDRGLSEGSFQLLIVGEAIRKSVQDLAEFIGRAPHLPFGIGPVELSCYRFGRARQLPRYRPLRSWCSARAVRLVRVTARVVTGRARLAIEVSGPTPTTERA
jgi:hypothetical protein